MISFVISVVNIAHAVTSVDFQFDTSKIYRAIEPTCYGCYPAGLKGDVLFVAFSLFALGYVAAKLVVVAMLGSVAPALLMAVMATESVALWLVRFLIGNWKFYNPAGDVAVLSVISHFLGFYPIMIAAPFPMTRHPFFLTPLVYSGFVVWTLFIANPMMLAFACQYDLPPVITNSQVVWMLLGGVTVLSVLASLVAFLLMEPNFRSTFYKHRTMRKHVRESYWARSTKWNGKPITCRDDLDSVRASTLKWYAKAYWPNHLARQWVRDGWGRWLAQNPKWFSKSWQARIPKQWFDGDDGSETVPMTRQEATFRKAIGRMPPWDLNARDLETHLDDGFVNSVALSTSKSEKTKRRQLVHQLAGAGGAELLGRCCAGDT